MKVKILEILKLKLKLLKTFYIQTNKTLEKGSRVINQTHGCNF